MGNSKGSKAEREVAAILQAWWKPFEPMVDDKPLQFTRVPLSGGWSKGENHDVSADIHCNSKRFPFAVEVKRRESWAWPPVMAGKPSPVWGWWRQAQRDAERTSRQPMLWFRHNRQPWNIMVSKEFFDSKVPRAEDSSLLYGHSWDRLHMKVDCGADPLLFTQASFLWFMPEVFAR